MTYESESILIQEGTNAAVLEAVKQVKNYPDSVRSDIPMLADSSAVYDSINVEGNGNAIAYAETELVDYVDDFNTVLYNTSMFYQTPKLENVRFKKLKNITSNDYIQVYVLNQCPKLKSVKFDCLQDITASSTIQGQRGCIVFLYKDPELQTVDLPNLKSITVTCSASYTPAQLYFLYGCNSLTNVNLHNLKTISITSSGATISSSNSPRLDFLYSSTLTGNLDLSSLTTIECISSATGGTRQIYNNFMRECKGIEHIEFPSLTTIKNDMTSGAFSSGQYPLINNYFLYKCLDLKTIIFQKLTTISHSVPSGPGNNNYPTIYNYFLYGCISLESVSFPMLTSITHASGGSTGGGGARQYNYMLQGCTSLTHVDFPRLETISAQCTGAGTGNISQCYFMQGCTSLQNVSFPKLKTLSVTTSAGSRVMAFLNGCTSLETVQIGTEAFGSITALSAGVLPADTTAFTNCPNLIDIEIGNNTFNGLITQDLTILCKWVPTNVLSDPTKCAQWNANIRNHIAANCVNGSYTITFNSALDGTGYLEQSTIQAFIDKQWSVAYI